MAARCWGACCCVALHEPLAVAVFKLPRDWQLELLGRLARLQRVGVPGFAVAVDA